ncbi:MAG: beta-lactamase family protein [Actinomycetia bacterium]|nr:beta-lactamase family protein [Actinomycetes bacterium]
MTTKKTVIMFVIAFFLFTFISMITTAQKDLQDKLQELVDTELATYKEKVPDYPGGLAMKVISKQGTFFVSAGMGTDITDQIHFRAASNTKTFTATAILLLHQQGKLDINHKIIDATPGTNQPYVPDTPEHNIPYKDSITILDLLCHRAGVFDISNNPVPDTVSAQVPYKGLNYIEYILDSDPMHTFTFDELVNVVAQCELSYFIPNTGYHYSNTGYSILGKIIERVSQKSYQQFLMEDIILPMGLQNTSMPVLGTDQNIPEPFVPGYILTADSLVNVTLSNMSANVAEGNLITTPNDLGHFLKKLLSGQGVLSPHLVNSVMMNYLPTGSIYAGGYGCGLTYLNNLGYGHNGAHEGYLSQMAYDPQTGFTVVVFTNCWNLKDDMSTLLDQLIYLLENNCYKAKQIVNAP